MANPQEWYESLAPVTKVWLTSGVASGLLARFGLLNPDNLALVWPAIFSHFQVWRLVTNFAFFGAPSFPWLMHMFFMSKFIPAYENDPFPSGGGPRAGNIADMVYMLLFGALVTLPIAYLVGLPFLSISLFAMVVYVWSKRHPDVETSFYMFRVKAEYLPWVMVGFTFIIGGNPIMDLVGIAAGHLYYFIQEVLPTMEGPFKNQRLLLTPRFLCDLLGVQSTHTASAYVRMAQPAGNAQQPNRGGGYNWGAGRRLND